MISSDENEKKWVGFKYLELTQSLGVYITSIEGREVKGNPEMYKHILRDLVMWSDYIFIDIIWCGNPGFLFTCVIFSLTLSDSKVPSKPSRVVY